MTVYVDDAMIPFRNMRMNHLISDTTEELLEMVRKIGVKVKWIQYPGQRNREHFDICAAKRILAIRNGAVSLSYRELALMDRDPKTGRLVKRISPGKG